MALAQAGRTVRLSELLGRTVTAPDGKKLGKVADVVVRLTSAGEPHPRVIGGVMTLGGRTLFVPVQLVSGLAGDHLELSTPRVDLRPFERRIGEILLKGDLLGHRLIDVSEVRLVRARDLQLAEGKEEWVLNAVEVGNRGVLARLRFRSRPLAWQDWEHFEPLIGHGASAGHRRALSGLRRLRPAELADLLEDANRQEGGEILDTLSEDKELQADVFEELEDKTQVELLDDRMDTEVAAVLGRMDADDAADLLTRLPQPRRLPILGLLPDPLQTKLRTLLGYHPDTAGGLMTPDFLAVALGTTVQRTLELVRAATEICPEVLLGVYITEGERLVGSITLSDLLQADPGAPIDSVAEADPIRVDSGADVTEVAVRMTDFNLVTLPVVDNDERLLGVITVDDVLELTVPDDWWDRVEDSVEPKRPPHTRRRAPGS